MESIEIQGTTKGEIYQSLLPQIEALVAAESDLTANLANVAAVLHSVFGFWWTGFYIIKEAREPYMVEGHPQMCGYELVLGPFQGPLACTRIRYGRGVCGTAWQRRETVIVEDVEAFPGHIACSSASRSEIVVPMVLNGGQVLGVLDIDSENLATFDDVDKEFLEKIVTIICKTAE